MKNVLKYGSILYLFIAYIGIYGLGNFFVLKPDPNIYSLVPQDANQIIELNSKVFVKKSVLEFFYNKEYVLPFISENAKKGSGGFKALDYSFVGVDVSTKVVFFSEQWEDEILWYGVFGVQNEERFTNFIKSNEELLRFELVDGFAICLLNKSNNLINVSKHLKQIANKKVKSIDSKIDLSEMFSSDNEINCYVSTEENNYIIDGFASIKFDKEDIVMNGEFNTVGSFEDVKKNKSYVDMNAALSLRTVLSSDEVFVYDRVRVDYKGTNIITLNETVPMRVFPGIQIEVLGVDSLNCIRLLESLDTVKGFSVNQNIENVEYVNEATVSTRYKLSDNKFVFYNDSLSNNDNIVKSGNIFELNVFPDLFSERINFIEDDKNPPSMLSNLKIGVFQNVLDQMASINRVEQLYTVLNYSEDGTKLVLNGKVNFKEKSGHSIFESVWMMSDLIKAAEMFGN